MQIHHLPGLLCRDIEISTILPPDNAAATFAVQISRCHSLRCTFPGKGDGLCLLQQAVDRFTLCQHILLCCRTGCIVSQRRFRFIRFFCFSQVVKLIRLCIPVQYDILFLRIAHIACGSFQFLYIVPAQIKSVRRLTGCIFAGESDITTFIRRFPVDQRSFFINDCTIIPYNILSGIQSIDSTGQRLLHGYKGLAFLFVAHQHLTGFFHSDRARHRRIGNRQRKRTVTIVIVCHAVSVEHKGIRRLIHRIAIGRIHLPQHILSIGKILLCFSCCFFFIRFSGCTGDQIGHKLFPAVLSVRTGQDTVQLIPGAIHGNACLCRRLGQLNADLLFPVDKRPGTYGYFGMPVFFCQYDLHRFTELMRRISHDLLDGIASQIDLCKAQLSLLIRRFLGNRLSGSIHQLEYRTALPDCIVF